MGETDILYLTTQGLIDRFLHADNIITLCYVYLHIFLLVHIIHSIKQGWRKMMTFAALQQ